MWLKILNGALDTLLFIVPLMDVAEVMAFIPPEWYPLYMLAVLILRRTARVMEDHLRGKKDAA